MTSRPDPEPLLPVEDVEEPGRLAVRVTCRACGRPLHDPESRLLRFGPGCRPGTEPVRRHDVDQDALPGL
jgi:hypothetical protein